MDLEISSLVIILIDLVFRDKLLVTGGYSWNSILGKTESLNMSAGDLSKWSSLSNLNTPRYLHACSQVLLDAKNEEVGVIVSGGYSDSYLNSTEIFYPSENRLVCEILFLVLL